MKEIYTLWGYTRFFGYKFGMELWYDLENTNLKKLARAWMQANRIIERYVGVELSNDELLELRLANVPGTHPLRFMVENALDKHLLVKYLRENRHLQQLYCHFLVVQLIQLLNSFPVVSESTEQSLLIVGTFLKETLNETILFLLDFCNDPEIQPFISLKEMLSVNADKDIDIQDRMAKIKHISSKVASLLTPTNIEVLTDIDVAIQLSDELDAIEAGAKYWKNYERYCYKILSHLFAPPFEGIHFQHGNQDRTHIRDLILVNDVQEGFWSQIRSEYGSKNIICEFKNEKQSDTRALAQLTMYLDKPSFGNFGIMLARKANQSLIRGIRSSYEGKRNIYVLLIEDELLKEFIVGHALLKNSDRLLQFQKAKFETSF